MSLALVLDVHLSLLVMAVLVWEQGALLLLLCWAMLELMLCTIGLVAGTPLLRISATRTLTWSWLTHTGWMLLMVRLAAGCSWLIEVHSAV